MLNITLNDEVERCLVEILAQEKTTSHELLQRLLHQHWQNLQPQKTVLERMGDRPRHFLSGPSNLSDRDVRKQIISECVKQHHERNQ
ncbi:MAG: hypothetical protein LH702_32210 [Phormidesmis sp. CAN_BIN44]|nr:hypothetical protein [Phormidesmis sp. CAN_BIN44]